MNWAGYPLVADDKMGILVLIQSLKSRSLSSDNFQLDNSFCGAVSAPVEQSKRKVNIHAKGHRKLEPEADPKIKEL